jgi:hypothetical protein
VQSAEEVFLDGANVSRREATAAYALASVARGDRVGAFGAIRALEPLIADTDGSPERALASATASRLTVLPAGSLGAVAITIDGTARTVPVVDGVAELPSRALSSAGTHVIVAALPAGAAVQVDAHARFVRPWNAMRDAASPFVVALDGDLGARDTHAALVLRVQNRAPRLVAAPLVQIDLPAGAEIDAETRARIDRRLAHASVVAQRTLVLPIRGLAPGATVRIPIRVRWTVSGALRGLAVAAMVSRDPRSAATVLAPRALAIPDSGEEPVGVER